MLMLFQVVAALIAALGLRAFARMAVTPVRIAANVARCHEAPDVAIVRIDEAPHWLPAFPYRWPTGGSLRQRLGRAAWRRLEPVPQPPTSVIAHGPGRRRVLRHDDPRGRFTRTWTFIVRASGAGSEVTLTEVLEFRSRRTALLHALLGDTGLRARTLARLIMEGDPESHDPASAAPLLRDPDETRLPKLSRLRAEHFKQRLTDTLNHTQKSTGQIYLVNAAVLAMLHFVAGSDSLLQDAKAGVIAGALTALAAINLLHVRLLVVQQQWYRSIGEKYADACGTTWVERPPEGMLWQGTHGVYASIHALVAFVLAALAFAVAHDPAAFFKP